MSLQWRAVNQDTGAVTKGVEHVQVTLAYNRFARRANLVLVDPQKTQVAAFPKYTPVDMEVSPDGVTWTRKLGGFVMNPQSKGNKLKLGILSHDYWLRHREVVQGWSSTLISTILQDLIEQYTPLTWVPGNVTVTDDQSITRQWKGERLDEVITELSSISGDEVFGANDDGEFFFRPPGTTVGDPFPENKYLDAEWDDDAKREVNRVTLYWNEADPQKLVVNDNQSQSDLQTALGTPRPVVIEKSVAFPEIDAADQADRKAQEILNEATGILTGRLWTIGREDLEPGQVVHTIDSDRGVDEDFVIAEVQWTYPRSPTTLKLAENEEGVIDILVTLSDEVTRIDLRSADVTAAVTQQEQFTVPQHVNPSLEVYKIIPEDSQALEWGAGPGWAEGSWGGSDKETTQVV